MWIPFSTPSAECSHWCTGENPGRALHPGKLGRETGKASRGRVLRKKPVGTHSAVYAAWAIFSFHASPLIAKIGGKEKMG